MTDITLLFVVSAAQVVVLSFLLYSMIRWMQANKRLDESYKRSLKLWQDYLDKWGEE